jgi:hypothetical protein
MCNNEFMKGPGKGVREFKDGVKEINAPLDVNDQAEIKP